MLVIPVIIVGLLAALFLLSNTKASEYEGFDAMSEGINANMKQEDTSVAAAANASAHPGMAGSGLGNFGASDPNGNEMYNPVVGGGNLPSGGNCFPRDRLTSADLLPKDAADSRWAQANPNGQGDIQDMNFLTAGYHVGVDTVGASKKIPNLQLRSLPACPRTVVSPWQQSTVEYDYLRKPLEVGSDY